MILDNGTISDFTDNSPKNSLVRFSDSIPTLLLYANPIESIPKLVHLIVNCMSLPRHNFTYADWLFQYYSATSILPLHFLSEKSALIISLETQLFSWSAVQKTRKCYLLALIAELS